MKKITSLAIILFSVLLISCNGDVTETEAYKALEEKLILAEKNLDETKAELEKSNEDINAATADLRSKEDEFNKLDNAFKTLETEYNTYKEKMKPYEELSEKEAEAKKIEAEKAIEEKKAAEEKERQEAEAKAKEEAAKKAEEEKLGYETGITYDSLARNPDDYKLKKVKFYGKVIQVIEDDTFTQYRFAVDDDYDRILLIEIDSELIANNRILEDDYLTIYGQSVGVISYESALGGKITIPAVVVDKFDR